MAFWSKFLLQLLLIGVLAILAILGWTFLSLPTSLSEARFDYNLLQHAEQRSLRAPLSELMPGDWELVCNGHGYNGSFYLEKYQRIYPAVGDMQDGAWGLVFIVSDGSYTKAAGNCRTSGAYLSIEGCHARAQAVLSLQPQAGRCPSFNIQGGSTDQTVRPRSAH